MLDFSITLENLPRLLRGAALTLELSAWVLTLSLLLAVPVAYALNARRRWLSGAAAVYVTFFRGTPALIQIFLIYYGTGQFAAVRDSALWVLFREPYWCAIAALSLNGAAYTGRIIAGAIAAVPRGTIEAGLSLGLNWLALQRLVVAPLAIRIGFPAYTNEVIQTVKATSLASTITLIELTGAAQIVVNDTYAPYEVFLGAAAIYLVMTFTLARVFAAAEARLYRGDPRLRTQSEGLKTATEA